MATDRSNAAVQGSAGTESDLRPSVNPASANTGVVDYANDPTAPVNVTLALMPSSQSDVLRRRDHTELLGSIDNLFGRQHQPNGSAAAAAAAAAATSAVDRREDANRHSVGLPDSLRGVGAQFDGSGSGPGAKG
ncbi:hypothetical protein F4677DRAFT_31695 [Hypoxylon crocopeplum]|nr:hypothetical protein F4677DRAFT_31695 [Hypoxylon crocopeplum]